MQDDSISRQAAIDALIRKMRPHDNGDGTMTIHVMSERLVRETLNELPSAQPEQKTGKWIEEDRQNPHWYSWIHCSECGRQDIDAPASRTPYCPNCGARMENSNG